MHVKRNSEARLCNHCCSGEAMSIMYFECPFVNLVSSMQCAGSYCHLWPAWIYNIFPHNLTKVTIFEKKSYWTWNVCFDFLSNFCLKHFSHLRTERGMIENVYWSLCKAPVILIRFWRNLNFLDRFSQISQIPDFVKIRPVRAELLHADGRTDTWRS
jgi:hypothetical protein